MHWMRLGRKIIQVQSGRERARGNERHMDRTGSQTSPVHALSLLFGWSE
jgi:hypothetical protein